MYTFIYNSSPNTWLITIKRHFFSHSNNNLPLHLRKSKCEPLFFIAASLGKHSWSSVRVNPSMHTFTCWDPNALALENHRRTRLSWEALTRLVKPTIDGEQNCVSSELPSSAITFGSRTPTYNLKWQKLDWCWMRQGSSKNLRYDRRGTFEKVKGFVYLDPNGRLTTM